MLLEFCLGPIWVWIFLDELLRLETLIGGLIIQVGSVMIDTSIKSKLKQLENKMIGR